MKLPLSGRMDPGDWEGLDDPGERPRYDAILSCIDAADAVLDVGCGAGVLAHYLEQRRGLGCYLGIEPDASAVAKARSFLPHDVIVQTTDSEFTSFRNWDVIVFSDSLEYMSDPVGSLRRYANWLKPRGRIVATIYLHETKLGIRSRLRHLLNPRRPLSNVHCAEMVSAHLSSWPKVTITNIRSRGTTLMWRLWVACM